MPSFSSQLQRSWKFFTTHWKNLLLISLIPSLCSLVPILLIALISLAVIGPIYSSGSTLNFETLTALLPLALILLVFIAVAYLILSLWSVLAIFWYLKYLTDGQSTSATAVLKVSLKQVPRFALLYVFTLLVITAGSLLFIIPGLIFAAWFSAVYAVFVNEGLSGFAALKKSRAYTRGHVLAIFGRYLLLSLLAGLVYLVFSLIPFVNILAGLLGNFIFTSLLIIFNYHLYLDLKSKSPPTVHPTSTSI